MFSTLKLQPLSTATRPISNFTFSAADINSATCPYHLRLPSRRSASISVRSQHDASSSSRSSHYISSVGSPPSLQLSQWTLTQRHILMLNVIAGAAAISAAWLFFSAIPTLLSFKRASESLEKLMDTAREELPDTMAAVRLSEMEISDLTMELSDLGQEINKGVRSSTHAVRVAEERLRQLTVVSPPASVQAVVTTPKTEPAAGPAVAKTARDIREGIVKGRSMVQLVFTVINFSRMAFKYFGRRANH